MPCKLGQAHSLTLALHQLTTRIVLTVYNIYSPMPEAEVGNAPTPWVLSQTRGLLPIVTNPGDQTKNQVILHVEHPTKPYRNLCSRCESAWCVWLGQGSAYQGLPINRSGSTAVLVYYYQSLPAAVLNTHTMISSIVFYILIVGLLAYASYLRHQITKK